MKVSQILAVTTTLENDIVLQDGLDFYNLDFVKSDGNKIIVKVGEKYIEPENNMEDPLNDI